MTRFTAAFILVIVAGVTPSSSADAQSAFDLGGRWTLNRAVSQFPREIGFSAVWLGQLGPAEGAPAGGRGRGGGQRGGVTGASTAVRESQEDAEHVRRLTAEVRDPSAHLAIVDTPAAITITDDGGQSRTFHPTGKGEAVPLDGTTVEAITTRDGGRLVIRYKVGPGRELRYTLSRVVSPAQLAIAVQFVERGGGDEVTRIYEPTRADEPTASTPPPAAAPSTATAGSASLVRLPEQAFNQQPDAALKGLTKLGVVVEDLTPQAAACGLKQGTLETAVSKHLSDAGFKVLVDTDEDTYVYVNIITSSPSAGLCVSRYDVFLYTHTTARLSYQDTPVLVQVSLLHKGGLAGGAPATHADGVIRGVQEYVDQVSARVSAANK